ncbi:Ig-like domain-containing protein [Vibrio aerogenes]|uniref:Ig-like domain-containing protein n=1 Tax=Vibrio aerogenes TaxID=92172 RepID=UPI0021C47ED3|nr:Ig-like domain-containing protein [Vibrio aerogenes]
MKPRSESCVSEKHVSGSAMSDSAMPGKTAGSGKERSHHITTSLSGTKKIVQSIVLPTVAALGAAAPAGAFISHSGSRSRRASTVRQGTSYYAIQSEQAETPADGFADFSLAQDGQPATIASASAPVTTAESKSKDILRKIQHSQRLLTKSRSQNSIHGDIHDWQGSSATMPGKMNVNRPLDGVELAVGSCGSYTASNTCNSVTACQWVGGSCVDASSDTTPPVFENSTPSQNSVGDTSVEISVDIDEAGTVYAVAVADGDSTPSSAQVIAGQNAAGSGADADNSVTLSSGSFSGTISLTGLSSGTAYDIYVVAQDDESPPIVQTSPTRLDITTTTPNNAPEVDLNGATGGTDNTASFSEGGGAVTIAPAATVTDADGDTITTITVSLTNDQDGADEGLNVTAAAQDALSGISGSSEITLQDTISITSATASAAEVQTFLRTITYNNTSSTPDSTARSVTVVINDGTDDSTTRTSTVSVTDVTAATTAADGFNTTTGTGLSPGIMFSSGDETLTIGSTSHTSGTANGVSGTDTLVTIDGADISGWTLSNFDTLNVPASTTVTMTSAQHNGFTSFTDNATQTIALTSGSDDVTGDATIETYQLGASYSGTFTLGTAAQNVTGADSAADTVDIDGLTVTGTLNGGTGTDVLEMGTGSNLSGATVSGFETLTLDSGASVTMTEAQHDAFSFINGAGTGQITISAATDGFSANATIETYVLGAANAVTLGAVGQNITGSSGDDTVNLSSGSYTGTLDGGSGTNTLVLANGADVTGATLSNFSVLTLPDGASVEMLASQLGIFSSTSATGTQQMTVSGDDDFTTLDGIETYVVGDDTTNTRTITLGGAATDVSATSATDAVTFSIGALTYTGTLTGEATVSDMLALDNGADITGATLNHMSDLTIASGASVTMTEAQHDSFNITANGTNAVTIADATDGFTGDGEVENYTLGSANTITLGTSGASLSQNVTGSSGNDTLTLGAAAYSGTFNGGDGTDTLVLADGANIASATISHFENLTLASGASVTMSAAQLAQFSGTITAAGAEQITVTGDGDFTTLPGVESYFVGDDSTDTRTITLGDATTSVSATSGSDAVTFELGSLTYTGSLTGEGTVNDSVSVDDGGDLSGATLSGIENLMLANGASITMSASQQAVFNGTVTAAGNETVNVTGDGSFTTLNNIESYIVGDSSSDSRTITLGSAATSVTATAVTDAVTFDVGTLTYTGTLTGDSTVADTITMDNSGDISGATINSAENLTLASGAGVSMTPAQLNGFSGTMTAPGSETVTFSGDGTLSGSNLSALETLATLAQASADTITLSAALAAGKTLIAGDTGSDGFVVTGSTGSQSVTGSAGGDTIDGGDGDDTLSPGAGTDTVTGGAGGDTFTGSVTDLNGDTIADLSADDRILLTGITGLSTSDVSFNAGTTLQIDTDANTGNGYEVQMTLSDSAGNNLTVDTVADTGSDTGITFVTNNTDPVITMSSALVTDENSSQTLTFSYTDADGDTVTAVQKTAPSHGSISISGTTITYTPATGYSGSDSFELTFSDGNGYSSDKTITVTVNAASHNSGNNSGSSSGSNSGSNSGGTTAPVNNAPVITLSSALITDEDSSGTVSFSYTDADGDTVTAFVKTAPQHGSLGVSGTTITYTPAADYSGSDHFVLTLGDGNGYTSDRTVNVTVNPVNDVPVANDDTSLTFTANAAGTYTLDVLANDTDADDDALQIVWVTPGSGRAVIQGNTVVLTTETTGTFTLKYGISDGNGGTDSASVTVVIVSSDALAPIVTPPADVEVNATGLFTRINPGVATAKSINGETLPVTLTDLTTTFFKPGLHTVYWQAEDNGHQGKASQRVIVHPLVTIGKDEDSTEGTAHSVGVYLNGEAPFYPLVIPYTVSGSADSSDHDLVNGHVIISSGTEGHIAFNIVADEEPEGTETLIITLDSSLNLGSKSSYTLSIHETNVAPEVRIAVTQNGESRTVVESSTDTVTVTATVTDANAGDSHTYEWINHDSHIVNLSDSDDVFSFSPAALSPGIYHLVLEVSDGTVTTSSDIYIEVVAELAALGTDDSDGDQIPDSEEGYKDSDNDGIPDYLDAISECNVIQEHALVSEHYLIEGEDGVCLRKGVTLAENETGGTRLMTNELADDPQAQNVGGIFDFIAYGLPKSGQSFQIVLPQRQPVPSDAVYRKYSAAHGWTDYIEDGHNHVYSAAGEEGYCPPPGDSVWSEGLTEGHWCVQLTIEDGGPNDHDGEANSAIEDPGGVATRSENRMPEVADDTVSVEMNGSVTIDVLSNDTDADSDTLSIASASADLGLVAVTENRLLYTPATDFYGTDTVHYSVTDNNGGTAAAVVTVNVIKTSVGSATPSDSATSSSGSSGSVSGLMIFVLGLLGIRRRR